MKVRPKCEPDKVVIKTGQDAAIPASLPHTFTINTADAGSGDLKVNVLGPDGTIRPIKLRDCGDGVYEATYIPDDCGRYKVDVTYDGKNVPVSPFYVQAYATGDVSFHIFYLCVYTI